MTPRPTNRVPILIGGMSEVALKRAARHDGWIGDICSTDDAIGYATRLRDLRAEIGVSEKAAVVAALNDALVPADFARAEAGGVTDVMTQPWMYYYGRKASLDQKLDRHATVRGRRTATPERLTTRREVREARYAAIAFRSPVLASSMFE